jgi:hypothetical protein
MVLLQHVISTTAMQQRRGSQCRLNKHSWSIEPVAHAELKHYHMFAGLCASHGVGTHTTTHLLLNQLLLLQGCTGAFLQAQCMLQVICF